MTPDFDLFGNPILIGDAKRGRPEHEPSEENIIFVMVLLAAGQTNKEVAATLGLSVPTFRKHYFHLLRQRDLMLDRLRTKLRVSQIKQGLSGNSSALNAALATLDKVKAESAQKSVENRGNAKKEKAVKLGKKEQRQLTAENIGGKFAPPSAPKLIVDNR
ncbi:hypothetical protein [Rhizobium sp. Root483D2]|uniref:hypothetical protein n=1 Tax=Rhizobium sp. Root483D2 TaxID=1736545 RepID=UPI000715A9ED|nr:hypothetical protein [Rhizobium sp. Root483D2]KQY31794.1 hypothetical protein ASD32_04160 [Rhizobium sp. Root483D2]